jgi:hypothetical protein
MSAVPDTSPLADAARLYPALYLAATDGPASFPHIAEARRIRTKYPQDAQISRVLEQALRRKFAEVHGRIRKDYWCVEAYGGCALTDKEELHSALNTHVPDLVDLEVPVRQLARDIERIFANDALRAQREESADALYSTMSRIIATADVVVNKETPADGKAAALAAVRSEWLLTRQRIEALIQRQARFEYFTGVLLGAPLAVTVFSILGWLAAIHWRSEIVASVFLAASIAGTIGAVISVFQRMSAGQLVLDYTASRRQKLLLGTLRPAVGGIFATIVQFALLGGLLAMQTGPPTATTASFAFFTLAGFVSGFSERFATDMIERAGQVISGTQPNGADRSTAPPVSAAAATGQIGTTPPPSRQD